MRSGSAALRGSVALWAVRNELAKARFERVQLEEGHRDSLAMATR